MKLIFSIVHNEDGRRVMDELNAQGFSVTKLCSTGGFLRAGNTTLLVGVEEDRVNEVIEIIDMKSKSRKHGIQTPMSLNGMDGVFIPNPVEVMVGGATIFIMDVERFEKV